MFLFFALEQYGIFVGAFMLRIDKLHYGHVFWKLIFHPAEDEKRMKLWKLFSKKLS